jgi:hypothetical protein
MWAVMMAGEKPFTVQNGELQLTLKPSLPGWLFNNDGSASFTFLGSVHVKYLNPSKADSWNLKPSSAKIVYLDGTTTTSSDGIIRGTAAEDVRSLKVASIEVTL